MKRKVFAIISIDTEYMDVNMETYTYYDKVYDAFTAKIGEFFLQNLIFSKNDDNENYYGVDSLGKEFNLIEIVDGNGHSLDDWKNIPYESLINDHGGEIYVGFNYPPHSTTFILKEIEQEC